MRILFYVSCACMVSTRRGRFYAPGTKQIWTLIAFLILCVTPTRVIIVYRLGRLPKKLSALAQCVFVDGPILLPLREGEQVATRSWWQTEGRPEETQESFDKALTTLEGVWAKEGPFQGVLGFSMGASMACVSVLCYHEVARCPEVWL